MSDKGFDNNTVNKDEEKILYGVNKKVCFACGEKIDKNTDICPYCKTTVV
ncbi:MAG: hypothetical protein ACXAEX_17335 [Promethearchaeota archaeon]|jgi:rRNA maturation endonuclease Nob1